MEYLTKEKIKDIIQSLANSQGFYGRLYDELESSNSWRDFTKLVNKAECKTVLDVVLFIEN